MPQFILERTLPVPKRLTAVVLAGYVLTDNGAATKAEATRAMSALDALTTGESITAHGYTFRILEVTDLEGVPA